MVEGRAQAIDITLRADVALVGGGLLWRHVTGRTESMAGKGEARMSFDSPRESEIRHTRPVVGADQDVRWLEITVQNAALVRILNCFGNGSRVCGRPPGRQRLVLKKSGHVGAVDIIHYQEVL